MEERKLYSQTLWVDDLLHLRIRDEEQIKVLIGTEFKRLNALDYQVILIEFEHNKQEIATEDDGVESAGYSSCRFRHDLIFERHSFIP